MLTRLPPWLRFVRSRPTASASPPCSRAALAATSARGVRFVTLPGLRSTAAATARVPHTSQAACASGGGGDKCQSRFGARCVRSPFLLLPSRGTQACAIHTRPVVTPPSCCCCCAAGRRRRARLPRSRLLTARAPAPPAALPPASTPPLGPRPPPWRVQGAGGAPYVCCWPLQTASCASCLRKLRPLPTWLPGVRAPGVAKGAGQGILLSPPRVLRRMNLPLALVGSL